MGTSAPLTLPLVAPLQIAEAPGRLVGVAWKKVKSLFFAIDLVIGWLLF